MNSESVQKAAPRKKRNAGRNLPAAIATGILLGGTVLFVLLGVPALTDSRLIIMGVWTCLVALLIFLGLREVLARLSECDYRLPTVLVQVCGQAIIWSSLGGIAAAVVAFVLSVVVLTIVRLFQSASHPEPADWLKDVTMGVYVLAWIPFLASFVVLLMDYDGATASVTGSLILVTFISTVVAADTGGYTFGVLWGKYPLAPKVSPKKSWEGLAGSLTFAVVCAVLLVVFVLKLPWWVGLLLGIGLTFSDIFGDLVESQFKRALNIKDMSTILPGHGGVMDRVDGVLPSAAMTWVVITVLNALPGVAI